MNKHSKGPWYKNRNWLIADANGHPICVDGFSFGSHSTEESQANTRRIVACINACEGFSIEELEGADLFKDSIESQSEIIALKKHLDELLEALIGLLGETEAIAQVMPAYGESQNIKNARAAISKAGGEV